MNGIGPGPLRGGQRYATSIAVTRSVAYWLFGALLLACGDPPIGEPPIAGSVDVDDPAKTTHALDGRGTFFLLRRDTRICPAPKCGGAFVHRVNFTETRCADGTLLPECYVAEVRLPREAADRPDESLFRGALSVTPTKPTLPVFDATEVWSPDVLLGRPPEFPPSANVNSVLLERARQRHPQAFVIFKPHPDVEHLGRAGALSDRQMSHADVIARGIPLENLLSLATHVETYSSLAGFEALLRGISVTTHGLPFYAGWGLTDDRAVSPRRGRNRSLDELTAVALIRYPRYWDPVSGLACPPEVALFRIAEARARRRSLWRRLGLAAGRSVILAKRFARLVKRPENDT